jgi:hypothetical protein
MRKLLLTLTLSCFMQAASLMAQDSLTLDGSTWYRFSTESLAFKSIGENQYEVVENNQGILRKGKASLITASPRPVYVCVFVNEGNSPGNYDALIYLEMNETSTRLVGKYIRGINIEQLMYVRN